MESNDIVILNILLILFYPHAKWCVATPIVLSWKSTTCSCCVCWLPLICMTFQ